MENQKKSNNVLLIILVILILGLGGFIVYDKVLNSNEKCDNQDEIINNEENYIQQKMFKTKSKYYNEMSMKNYFEYYMRYIPWQDDNSALIDINNLESERISFVVWRYIWENTDDKQMTISEVNNFLYEYFNLSNYDVKELTKEDKPTKGKPWNIFGLTKEDGYYKATVVATEFQFPEYKVFSIDYDDKTIKVNFGLLSIGINEYTITRTGTLTLRNNNSNFNFVKIEFNNL